MTILTKEKNYYRIDNKNNRNGVEKTKQLESRDGWLETSAKEFRLE